MDIVKEMTWQLLRLVAVISIAIALGILAMPFGNFMVIVGGIIGGGAAMVGFRSLERKLGINYNGALNDPKDWKF